MTRDPLATYPGMTPAERAEVRERRQADEAAHLARALEHAAEWERTATPEQKAEHTALTARTRAALGLTPN